MSKLKRTARLGLGAGGAISTVCGLIADFFMPIAPYGIYLGFAGLLILLISLGLFFIPATDRRLSDAMGDSWYLPSFVLLLVFTASMFGFYYMGKGVQGGNGYLAGSFGELNELQNEILKSTKQIESNTASTAENTREIADTVKKETSDDPRKELANRGISWNEESLIEAINSGDIENVQLFAQGGMTIKDISWPRIVSKIEDRGIMHFDMVMGLFNPDLEAKQLVLFYEYELNNAGLVEAQLNEYIAKRRQQTLDEYNQNVDLERERYTENYINYAKSLHEYLEPFLQIRKVKSIECSVNAKTLHENEVVLGKISDFDSIQRFSFPVLSINFALDKLEVFCPEFKHIKVSRPQQPDLMSYALDKKRINEVFLSAYPEKINLSMVLLAKLINPRFHQHLSKNGFNTETDAKLYLSNGEIININL